MVLLIGLVVLFFVFSKTKSSGFRVLSTNPTASTVSVVSPFFDITYSKRLSVNSVSLSSSNGIASSYKVAGAMLNITLVTPLQSGQSYTITVHSIRSINGNVIKNQQFTFTPLPYSQGSLSKDQQNAILKSQAHPPASVNTIAFGGTATLITDGLSVSQLYSLEKAFFAFSPNARTVTVDDSSVQDGALSSSSGAQTLSIYFNVAIDGTAYNATVETNGVTSVELVLKNPQTNTQVFDSGQLTTPGGD
jgi:hypothetical protein